MFSLESDDLESGQQLHHVSLLLDMPVGKNKSRNRKPASRAKGGGSSKEAPARQDIDQEGGVEQQGGDDVEILDDVNADGNTATVTRAREADEDQTLQAARDAVLNNPALIPFPTDVNASALDDALQTNAEDATLQSNAEAATLQSNAEDATLRSNVSNPSPALEDINSSDNEDTREVVPGPLSKEARTEAQTLGSLVVKESERIGRKFKKSRREIMLAAGLSTRSARATNKFNLFKTWYAHHNPKDKSMTFAEYSKHAADVYRKDFLSITDPEQRAAAFQPILEFATSEALSVNDSDDVALRSVVSVMNSAKDQFTNLAASYHNIEEIEVVGVIIYTGTDAAARQTSTIFGGSTMVQDILTDGRSDVRKIIDRITTEIKYADARTKGTDTSALDVERRPTETDRDRDRRVFSAMLHDSLSGFKDVPKKMSWKRWPRMAMQSELRIVNWPAEVRLPGPGFELKTLGTTALRLLVGEYISCKQKGDSFDDAPRFERWTEDEKAIPLDNIKKGNIPLIISSEGSTLQTLSQCDEWCKQYEKAHKSRNIRRRAGGLVVRDNDSDADEDYALKLRRPSPGRKPTKKATSSHYVEFSESDDGDLPYPDVSRKAKHHLSQKRSRSRRRPDDESHNSDDNRQVKKRKKQDRQMERSSDNDDSVAMSKTEKRKNQQRRPSHRRYLEGGVKKGKSKRAPEEAVDIRNKGKMKAVPASDNSASHSDGEETEEN